MDLREDQAGIRECIFTLAEHIYAFRGEAALRNDRAAKHIAGRYQAGIEVQSHTRFSFRFLRPIQ